MFQAAGIIPQVIPTGHTLLPVRDPLCEHMLLSPSHTHCSLYLAPQMFVDLNADHDKFLVWGLQDE